MYVMVKAMCLALTNRYVTACLCGICVRVTEHARVVDQSVVLRAVLRVCTMLPRWIAACTMCSVCAHVIVFVSILS